MADEGTDFEGAGEDEDNMDEEDVASPMQFMEEFADTPNSKLLRISEVQLMEQPESYRTNTPKEELMLEYIRKYEVHFANLHPKRRKPMLALRNECGMKKFICATLRPTQMPYQDVYDYNKCAKFVADFIRYEPLELASQLPSHMPSPSATLGWQAGDCFDMAMVLCSMLLGVGYDAYVVCGYAPAKITRYDQTSTSIKAEPPPPPPEPPYKPPDTKYTIGPRKVLSSNFLTQKAQREAAAAAPKDAKVAPAAPTAPIDLEALAAAEAEELDDLRGRRVHAWVLLLPGKRMLEQMLFVEPSTGELYRADSSPFYGIETLWNASNYWVNMQGPSVPAAKLSFELADASKWEGLLYDSTMASMGGGEDEGGDEGGDGAGGAEEHDEVVDESKVLAEMPPSWVTRLHVPQDLFESGCPQGRKSTTFKKGLVQKFAPYSREDGLVEMNTLYEDAERTSVAELRQHFANRQDHLYKRIVAGEETREYFEPGRKGALREHTWIEGQRRVMHFYSVAKLDGLVSRYEETGKKTWYVFDGTRDPLIYRSVSYDQEAEPSEAPDKNIRKMAEKFRRSRAGTFGAPETEVDAEEDVAKRTFELSAGLIKLKYHYGKDRVTASSRTYNKDGSNHHVVQVNSFSKPPTEAQLLDEFTKLQVAERECINEIKDYDRQTKEILKKRAAEEADIEEAEEAAAHMTKSGKMHVPQFLVVSVYDTSRSRINTMEPPEEDLDAVPHDYLTPFLEEPIGIHDDPLPREAALQAREACLRSLKERLVERANIVQSRLDDENAMLSKKQAAFQRNRDHMDAADEAEYERYCQEAMFRIQILEQRLDRHTELSLQTYAEMDARLRDDPRLKNLNSSR